MTAGSFLFWHQLFERIQSDTFSSQNGPFSKRLLCVLHDTCFQRVIIIIVTLCAICYHSCNFNNVKSTHAGVLLLVKFLVLLKVTLLHGCFLRSLSYTNINYSWQTIATSYCFVHVITISYFKKTLGGHFIFKTCF